MMNKTILYITSLTCLIISSCKTIDSKDQAPSVNFNALKLSKNSLDYSITPRDKTDRSGLMFSDQGAWFAYGFPDSTSLSTGFSGPFLMTEQNGVWSSPNLSILNIKDISWKPNKTLSFNSHLEQSFSSETLSLKQELVYLSGHTALIRATITNTSNKDTEINYNWETQNLFPESLSLKSSRNELTISSSNTDAIGHILFPESSSITILDSTYKTSNKLYKLKPKAAVEIIISQSFIFSEYNWEEEKQHIANSDFDSVLNSRKSDKDKQLSALINHRKPQFQDSIYGEVLAKAHLTLQNNWRIPAGEIKHEGLFPSYHYKWFNGFWSWDSWKHAVGLSYFDPDLAKEQMKLMFAFQKEDGFIVDCVYRDTSIESHNYRDTKPPLSAWAVAKIFERDSDLEFVKFMYPKLKKYHYWWYAKRDHDQDGLCEYGSTDGSLVAAKWESGMDNAIRFDDSKILKNSDGAYSLDQESVDLNAYLYAEKLFLAELAKALNLEDASKFLSEAEELKTGIQQQFYDDNDGWFYDTNLEGDTFIKGEGSEGWTALWANAATQEQAEAVKNRMMNPKKFYTKVPFQTMSADHTKFDPLKGYWRGPNWLDQAYFGVKSLRNYGFNTEADKATTQILKGPEGLLEKGTSIRENYHPITGEGLHAKNFSWSAAHIIMLLMEN